IPATTEGLIQNAIQQGEPVNLLVIVDDLAAQASLAALTGDTGIQESLLQDNRISETEARARALALLDQNHAVQESVRYRTTDRNTHTGATIRVDLATPTAVF